MIESLIVCAHDAGFKVNNLFEVAGGWRANLCDGDECFEFGEAATPEGALEQALKNALAWRAARGRSSKGGDAKSLAKSITIPNLNERGSEPTRKLDASNAAPVEAGSSGRGELEEFFS